MKKYGYAVVGVLLFFSCLKENEYVQTEKERDIIVNKWIYNNMSMYYYWSEVLPFDLNYEQKPDAFFQSLLFKQGDEDRFSWILENTQEYQDFLNGIKYSFGLEYVLIYEDSLFNRICGIIKYVTPDSPASRANIKRGDIFYKIDNIEIDINNYELLLLKKNAIYTFKNFEEKKSVDIELIAEKNVENPIFYKNIYEIENHKIGYLIYNMFIEDAGDGSQSYLNDLIGTFSFFKQEKITELILDLRYNPGGLLDLAVKLSSMISNTDSSKIALKLEYNKQIMSVLNNNEKFIKFSHHNPESSIGNQLKHIYIIIGSQTASSSEAVINCLRPYMPITLIGTPSYGKNFGSMLLQLDQDQLKWIMQPVVVKIYNCKGESDYKNGFIPDIIINELNYPLIELGNLNEPILYQAISLITNKDVSQSISYKKQEKKIHLNLKLNYERPMISPPSRKNIMQNL